MVHDIFFWVKFLLHHSTIKNDWALNKWLFKYDMFVSTKSTYILICAIVLKLHSQNAMLGIIKYSFLLTF